MEAARVLPPGSIAVPIVYKHSEMPYSKLNFEIRRNFTSNGILGN